MTKEQAQAKRAELLAQGADVMLEQVMAIEENLQGVFDLIRVSRPHWGGDSPEVIAHYSTFPNNPNRVRVYVIHNPKTDVWSWTVDSAEWTAFRKATMAWEKSGGIALSMTPASGRN